MRREPPTGDPVTAIEAWLDGGRAEITDQVLTPLPETRVGVIRLKLPRRDATVSVRATSKNGSSEPA